MTVTLPEVGDGPAFATAWLAAASANVEGRVVVPRLAGSPEGDAAVAADGSLSSPRRASIEGRRTDGAPVRLEVLVVQRGARLYQAAVVAPAPHPEAVDGFFDGVRRGVAQPLSR
jgi:hypothetical protein